MKKSELPEKVCPVCKLPFSWRKKWAKNWDNVKYCSEKCRRTKAKKDLETDNINISTPSFYPLNRR